MSLSNVQKALFTAAIANVGGIPVEGENSQIQRPTNSPWAVLTFIPNDPEVWTLGSTGQDKAVGLIQIDVRYPVDTGDSAARATFETVRAAFKAGKRFTSDGQQVTILKCGRSQGRTSGNWYVVNIRVFWEARIPR